MRVLSRNVLFGVLIGQLLSLMLVWRAYEKCSIAAVRHWDPGLVLQSAARCTVQTGTCYSGKYPEVQLKHWRDLVWNPSEWDNSLDKASASLCVTVVPALCLAVCRDLWTFCSLWLFLTMVLAEKSSASGISAQEWDRARLVAE